MVMTGCPFSGFSFVFSLINYFNRHGQVVQSRVSAKLDYRYKSWEGNSVLFFLPTIWCCKKKRENYLGKCFEQKKKKPALTFNSSKVSANQPSNNWAQNYNYKWLFFFFEICRSSVPRKKKRRKDHTRNRAHWAMTLINTPPPPPSHTHTHTHTPSSTPRFKFQRNLLK